MLGVVLLNEVKNMLLINRNSIEFISSLQHIFEYSRFSEMIEVILSNVTLFDAIKIVILQILERSSVCHEVID